MPSPIRAAATRTGAVGASLALAALLTACSNGQVEVGEARTNNTGPASPSVVPTATPTLSPYLDPTATTLGNLTLHLPLGWVTYEGQPVAAAGEGAEVQGAAQLITVPAEGRSAEEWAESIVAGETDLVTEGEALSLEDPLTAPGERSVPHISHDDADGRDNLFVTVEADSLHLLRFSGDGSTRAQLAAAESASTITVQVRATPSGGSSAQS